MPFLLTSHSRNATFYSAMAKQPRATWTLTSHSVLNCPFEWSFKINLLGANGRQIILWEYLLWLDNCTYVHLFKDWRALKPLKSMSNTQLCRNDPRMSCRWCRLKFRWFRPHTTAPMANSMNLAGESVPIVCDFPPRQSHSGAADDPGIVPGNESPNHELNCLHPFKHHYTKNAFATLQSFVACNHPDFSWK